MNTHLTKRKFEMKELITSNGYRTQVDDEDYDYFNQWYWYGQRNKM